MTKSLSQILWISILAISISACGLKKSKISESSTENLTHDPEITFLVLKITNTDSTKKSTIEMTDLTKSDGTLKPQIRDDFSRLPYRLEVKILENGKLIEDFTMEHPLFKQVEYYEENIPKSRFVSTQENSFLLRFQTHQNTPTEVEIRESLNGRKTDLLSTIKL